MSRCDKICAGTVLGFAPPVALALAGWWGSIPYVAESRIWTFLLSGFLLGLLIDAVFLRRWINGVYKFRTRTLAAIYVFYTLGVYGFCMGVPVFNLAVGAFAGAYVARRAVLDAVEAKAADDAVHSLAILTAAGMAPLCACSAVLALLSKSTPHDIQGMLNLPFTVTWSMVIALIVIGGIALVIAQYFLTVAAAKITRKLPA